MAGGPAAAAAAAAASVVVVVDMLQLVDVPVVDAHRANVAVAVAVAVAEVVAEVVAEGEGEGEHQLLVPAYLIRVGECTNRWNALLTAAVLLRLWQVLCTRKAVR